MRFYDRVEIQKLTRYRNEIIKRSGPVAMVKYRSVVQGGTTFHTLAPLAGTINLDSSINEAVDIRAVGPEVDFTDLGGTALKGRVNMVKYPRGEAGRWRFTGGVNVAYQASGTDLVRIRVTANTAGAATLTYRRCKDPTSSVSFNIT